MPSESRKSRAIDDLGFARVDHLREKNKGFPEVVFGPGKTIPQILAISERILARSGRLLITRTDAKTFLQLRARFPFLRYHEAARAIWYPGDAARRKAAALKRGHVLIVCAGTGDLPVAEEAALTARILGCRVKTLYDVGVAGLHRLLARLPSLRAASVLVTAAGMDAALPSVVAGLVDKPVVAVPTSIGYGSSFKGLSALLSMLNACSPGITVVNIDNGFGAGFAAAQMLRLAQETPAAKRKPARPALPRRAPRS
jgi:NCAIR mutase (PurE)-related protein